MILLDPGRRTSGDTVEDESRAGAPTLGFRRQMVELVRAGRSPEELSREFEPTAQAIRNWVAQGERDEGRRGDGPSTAEREEMRRLRREIRRLREERDILAKATAWFARGTVPGRSTGS